jgi:hypothetical protein
MANAPRITDFFRHVSETAKQYPPQNSLESIDLLSSEHESECDHLSIDNALQELNAISDISHNRSHERRLKTISKFDDIGFLAIEHYLRLLKKGNGKIKASLEVASTHFRHRKTNSQGRRIRI